MSLPNAGQQPEPNSPCKALRARASAGPNESGDVIDFEEPPSDTDASGSEHVFGASDLDKEPQEQEKQVSDDEQEGISLQSKDEDDVAAHLTRCLMFPIAHPIVI